MDWLERGFSVNVLSQKGGWRGLRLARCLPGEGSERFAASDLESHGVMVCILVLHCIRAVRTVSNSLLSRIAHSALLGGAYVGDK